MFKDRLKRVLRKQGTKRGAKITLVSALLVATIFGGGAAAMAAKAVPALGDPHYTYDYMPADQTGYYLSSDDGARAGISVTGYQVLTNGRIDWGFNSLGDNSQVHVQIALKDNLCDGDAAVVKLEFMDGDSVDTTSYWINTGGCGTTVIEHATFYKTKWDPFYSQVGDDILATDGIRVTVCNGGAASYGPMYFCGTQHGPFHH